MKTTWLLRPLDKESWPLFPYVRKEKENLCYIFILNNLSCYPKLSMSPNLTGNLWRPSFLQAQGLCLYYSSLSLPGEFLLVLHISDQTYSEKPSLTRRRQIYILHILHFCVFFCPVPIIIYNDLLNVYMLYFSHQTKRSRQVGIICIKAERCGINSVFGMQ